VNCGKGAQATTKWRQGQLYPKNRNSNHEGQEAQEEIRESPAFPSKLAGEQDNLVHHLALPS
jgi:hypothetical protein